MGDTKVMTTSKIIFLLSTVYASFRSLQLSHLCQENQRARNCNVCARSLHYEIASSGQKENCVLANCGAETLDQGQLSKTIKSLNPEPYLLTIGAAFDSEEIEEAIHQMERKLFREIPAEKCRASMSELSLSYANYDLNEDIEIQSCEPKNNKEMMSALVLTFFIVGLGVCIFVTMRIYCNLRQDLNSSREKLGNLKSSKEDCLLAEETLSYNST